MHDTYDGQAWSANWISYPYGKFDLSRGIPAPLFRRSFEISGQVSQAVVRLCGLGYHELYVNGVRIGDQVLHPPFTRFDKTVIYETYDIAAYLQQGENVLGIMLGNGMYNVFAVNPWDFDKAPWRDHPKFLLEAVISTDRKPLTIISDPAWQTSMGPIQSDNLYEGEIYDARLEQPDWHRPGYQDAGWVQAVICRGPGGQLKPMAMEPCRIVRRIRPVALWETRPGVWVYDMGINMTGWVQLRASGPAGTAIHLRFAEKLTPDGSIDPSNIDIFSDPERFQHDVYIMKGRGEEIWEPRFTYHGFQYVQVTGYPGTPQSDSLEGCIVHTDLSSRGQFACSNDLLNKIQAAARLSTLGNYHGMPTDCPHREKNGWTGDAALSAEQVLLNFQPDQAYLKWLDDIVDCQRPNGQLPGIVPTGGWGYNWGSGPAWDSVLFLLPWNLYLYRGDLAVLSRYYEPMKQYLAFIATMAHDNQVAFGLGDWCPPEGGPDDYVSPLAVTDTTVYALLCQRVADIAAILGYPGESQIYRAKARAIAASFNHAFVDEQTGRITGDCQTSYACALYAGLVEGPVRSLVIDRLVQSVEQCNRHIDCGILGAKFIMQVLTDIGRADLAYAIAAQTTFPGWGHWISQGATTLWETWNGNASRNHHMFSDISAWFYKVLAGINPDPAEPGFRHIVIKPHPVGQLEWVRASHQSPLGEIVSHWTRTADGLQLDLQIPGQARATLYLPFTDQRPVLEQGKDLQHNRGITVMGRSGEHQILQLQPGSYHFLS